MLLCSACGEENPDRAKFCLACATPLAKQEAGPSGERRKTVSIVFSDITGSTRLGEQLDPEALRRVMARYYQEMRAALESHGGTIEKFIGDAVMAVFGIPVMREDDALRAVRATLEMRRRLDDLNLELERRWGVRIRTRTGVNTGEVIAGDPRQGEAFVVGDAVNVAARLEQVADPDEILVGDETHCLVRDEVITEEIEPLVLKGKAEPVPAFRLLGFAERPSRSARSLTSEIIGRDAELAALREALDAAVEAGRCEIITVLGSPGVGKSRLLGEFVTEVGSRARVSQGRCLSYGEGITFWPVIEVTRDAAGINEGDERPEAEHKLLSVLAVSDEGQAVVERLLSLLGLTEGCFPQEETVWAVRKLFEALARERPLVVVFEDVHWGEPGFLDLIEHVAALSRDASILVVVAARPELAEIRSWLAEGGDGGRVLRLEPLDDDNACRMIESLVGQSGLASAVFDLVAESAGGNPLFLEEMLRVLVDDGFLERENGVWRATRALESVSVPPTVEALLGARLDHLEEEERGAVGRAAVIGKEFYEGAVKELSPESERTALAAALTNLVRKELIGRAGTALGDEEAFCFRHILVRDAAYQGMLKEVRAELHEAFADWLERKSEARASEFEEIVGYHLEQAHRYYRDLGPLDERGRRVGERAAAQLITAGNRAVARGDPSAAAKLLQRGISLNVGDEWVRLEAMIELGYALMEVGEVSRATSLMAEMTAAARAAGFHDLETHGTVLQAFLRLVSDPEVKRDDFVTLSHHAIAALEGNDLGLARAWRLASISPWRAGQLSDATAALERALDHAQAASAEREAAETFQWLVYNRFLGPRRPEELLDPRELEEWESRDRSAYAGLVGIHAGFEAMRGDFPRARELSEQAKTLYEELGLPHKSAAASLIRGSIELMADDPAAAERELRPGLGTLLELADRVWLPDLAALLAEAVLKQGKERDAARFISVSASTAVADDVLPQTSWRAVKAKLMARRGDTQEAERLAREAIALSEDTDALNHRGDAATALGEVLRDAGRPEDAIKAFRQAAAHYGAKGNTSAYARAHETATQLEAR